MQYNLARKKDFATPTDKMVKNCFAFIPGINRKVKKEGFEK